MTRELTPEERVKYLREGTEAADVAQAPGDAMPTAVARDAAELEAILDDWGSSVKTEASPSL